MHIGLQNIKYEYKMNGKILQKVREEKDLGVIINNDLKTSVQCLAASKKANKMLGFIARNFDYKSPEVITRLYTALVRPHLEYAVQFWSPCFIKDVNTLERVQRRATKLIPGLRNLQYETRLERLNMFSLKNRRIRGDLIELFKILKRFDDINYENMFVLDTESVTRTNGMKLKGKRFNTDLRKNYFNIRVINRWNALPASVVSARTIDTFKARLDKYFESNSY